MTQQIVVPALGESVTEATVAKWFKAPGDAIAVDEPLVELETDKVSVEVNAKSAGVLSEIIHEAGAEVDVGAVLGSIEEGGAPAKKAAPEPKEEPKAEKAPEPAPAPAPAPKAASANADMGLSPAVRKLVDDNGLDPATIP
ncbi:MAG: dihydrolipoamide succinyltransferase, partial [Rhodospirillales bacterium]|nr:dihydrolipoamide succinyltransferase [Rhodospirillales bacterium]